MIKINKPLEIPDKLAVVGHAETEKNIKSYEQFREDHETGTKRFEFDSDIYAHDTVKSALKKAQHAKCCFCEKKEEIGDVEHFRPKGGFRQNQGDRLSKHGYYWLAYDWDNLLFCCPKCNRSFKRDFFPLADESKRARSHTDDIGKEQPTFVHPANENPEEFIEFVGINPRAVKGNVRGSITIEKTGIDRPFLNEHRFEYYKKLKFVYHVGHMDDDKIDNSLKEMAIRELNESMRDSAEYASMIRCAIRDEFGY